MNESSEWHQWHRPTAPPQVNYRAPKPDPRPQPRPHAPEDILQMDSIQIERKTFNMALKENPRGRFLRITESAGANRSTLIVPATGLKEFQKLVDAMVKAHEQLPPGGKAPPAFPV